MRRDDMDLGTSTDLTVTVRIGRKEYTVTRCAYVGGNERCAYAGTMSDTTMPTPATRWWCRFHYECADASYGAMVVGESHGRKP